MAYFFYENFLYNEYIADLLLTQGDDGFGADLSAGPLRDPGLCPRVLCPGADARLDADSPYRSQVSRISLDDMIRLHT